MKSLVVKFAAAAALMAACALGQAQDLRIGYVSGERVLRDSMPAKAAQAKLEAEFSKREKELQTQGTSIKGMAEQLEREAPTLSESQRVNRQKQLVELDRDFQRKQREFREDLNQRRNEELTAVLERANKAIKAIAEAEKYDVILQEAVYAAPRVDITDKVIKALADGK